MSIKSGMSVGGRATDSARFVPSDFVVPLLYVDPPFQFVPIGPEHNEGDYSAWSSSIKHIRRTPGFDGHAWPREMTVEQNLGDIVRHADEFRQRTGFMYTVIVDGHVVGGVHIYRAQCSKDASVISWVRKDLRHLDAALYEAVRRWLRDSWPFDKVVYAPRDSR